MPKTREKRSFGGDVMDVDIFQVSDHARCDGRRHRKKMTKPSQRNLNDKNARHYLQLLTLANFTEKDYYITFSYNPDVYKPDSRDDAQREISNYFSRVNYYRKKHSLSNAKYIVVTEGRRNLHHHVLISGDIDRDIYERLWTKNGKAIGYVTARRIQFDDAGLTKLANYLTKEQKPDNVRRWTSSLNLKKPTYTDADDQYTLREVDKLARIPPDCEAWRKTWERKYKDYRLIERPGEPVTYNDMTGWGIHLRFIKKERKKC